MRVSPVIAFAFAATLNAELPPPTRAFLEKHCVDCHDADTKKGGLDLAALAADSTEAWKFDAWVKVHDRLRDGEMPPKKKPQPDAESKRAVLQWLDADLQRADAARQASEGRVVFRRLNRVEYEYTLRDLFSLPQLDVKEMLPSDAEAHGFDNIGAALTMSDVQMSRYLDAADAALDEALKLGPRADTEKQHIAALDDHGLNIALGSKKGTKIHGAKIGNALGLLRQAAAGQHPWTWKSFEPMADGDYKLRTKTFGFMWEEGKVRPAGQSHVISYYARMGTNRRWLASCDVPADEAHAAVAEVTVHLRQGEQLELYLASLDTRNPRSLAEHTGPGIAIEWLETEGPLNQAPRFFGTMPVALWTPASGLVEPPAPSEVIKSGKRAKQRKNDSAPRYLVVSREPLRDAERLLRGFMERAFRRPIPAGEVERYLVLVRAKLDAKICFQEALRTGLKAVLCSPDFLFFQETPGRLDDYALASRLTYFLWSSLPDEPLLALARSGALHQPETLRAQVERLLSDAKSQRFVENFTGQWLDLRNIRATEPDEQLYPEFDELLCDSMLRETHAFFDDMLRRDLSATHLVASDFAMVNGRLAKLYGIPSVEGLAIRRVPLPKDSPRGGLLTQASILKVSANGTTTSPVTRGAWVLKNLLGRPAPPPPPGIPAIEPDVRGATTVREQLAAHRSVESCALCHSKIDPPGFALESFDVMGGWRDRYRSLGDGDKVNATFRGKPVDYRLGPRVDASGELASGAKFKGIADFRQLLLASKDQLARNLTSKLLVYATGAGVQFADRAEIESILTRAKPHDYGLRTLIHEIVQSKTFQQK